MLLLALIPLFFYAVDGYYQNNVLKGFKYIGGFIVLITVWIILLKMFGLYFALSTPVFIIFIIISRPKKN